MPPIECHVPEPDSNGFDPAGDAPESAAQRHAAGLYDRLTETVPEAAAELRVACIAGEPTSTPGP